jgi:hypothetical protein
VCTTAFISTAPGFPAATICTDHFVATARATATVWGVPDYPVIYMPHPLSTLIEDEIQAQAQRMADQVIRVLLTGRVNE